MSNQVKDYVAHGFHKLDEKYLENHPPKIVWTAGWRLRSPESKMKYLEKLANTMNHAAKLLQGERDELGRLCRLKEDQLVAQGKVVEANIHMLQTEVTKMNEWKQKYLATVQRLNAEIKSLRDGNHDRLLH